MKAASTLLALILLTFAAAAQSIPEPAPPSSGCGPSTTKFEVKLNRNEHRLGEPESGKALVYIIEVFQRPPGELGTPTIRVGLNGNWVGADRGTSYFSFPVDAGENHLCVNWQSIQRQLSHQHAVTDFVAEPGKTYFFQVEIRFAQYSGGGGQASTVWSFDLKPINPEQGKDFIAASPLSIFRPKT